MAAESTETTISLRWQKPLAKVGAYRLVYVSSDGEVSEDEIPPMQTSYVMINLTPGMSYRVTLAAERGLKKSTPAAVTASTGGSQYHLIRLVITAARAKITSISHSVALSSTIIKTLTLQQHIS